MIKGLLLSFSLLAMAASSSAQILSSQGERCGFDRHHRQLMLSDPAYAQRVADYEARTRHFSMDDRDAGTLFVPVVVHVLETGTAITAITDDQIRTGIRQLNERYRKVAGTPGAGNGVDTHIEFALAVRDPSGSCTTGITRHDMTGNATYMASGVFDASAGITDAAAKAIGVWDQTKYYNIWLVSEFDNNNGGSGTQGYAFFSSSHGFPEDGTIMLVNAYKDATSITLAHELGHAFNVYHTFEGDANGTTCPLNGTCGTQGDQVCDTPPHIRSNSDCNLAGTNSCDGGSSNVLFKNNYMDYSGDACQNMFTAGQNTRIQSALTVDRASFLAANGNMSLVPPGAPTMQIIASKSVLCGIGQSVQLFDWSRCIPNTYLTDPDLPGITFAWTITNGTETQNSSNQNPVFTLNSLGVFNATLQITTSLGTYTRTENGIVVVVASPGAACTPTSLNPSGNYGLTVYNVAFNTINSATDPIGSVVYTDYSCTRNTVVARGSTYQLSVSITSGSASAEVFSAYIDYNNNNIFDTGELVSTGTVTNGATTVNANVTIPVTAVTGSLLRLRVFGEVGTFVDAERTCSSQMLLADVEDYGVYVTTNLAAVSIAASPGTTITYGTNVTFTPTPVNGGAGPTYQWFRSGNAVGAGSTYASNNLLPGETISCEMFSNLAGVIASPATSNTLTMTVTGPPQSDFTGTPLRICAGGSVAFTDLSLLSPTGWSWTFTGGTPSTSSAQNPTVTYASPGTYNVTLVASNANGTGTTMTKTGYITVYAAPNAGCAITRSTATTSGIGITNVTLNTINNNTIYDGAVMNDYTCSNITLLSANTLYNISVTVGAFNNQWVRAYIDYNGNGVFTDSGEQIFAPANGTGARTGSFTTPVAPTANVLRRMRVISDFLNTTPGPCATPLQYGQVEEYGIVFLAPVNTAPVLNTAASPALSAQNEDAVAPAGAVGTLVSSLVDLNPPAGGLDNVTDPDAGAVAGIAVTAADATNGTWFYSINNGGVWSALGVPSGAASRLLAADANSRLYFQPLANFNGSIASAITFRAWDQTSGTNGGTADASVNGGTTAYSTATDVASIVITAVNDAPSLNSAASPVLTSVIEDAAAPSGAVGTLVSALVDFAAPSGQLDNVTDVDAGAVTGIAITAADATNGSWFYSINNGSVWSPLGTPSSVAARLLAADANSRLYFQPTANFSGSIASAITFRAWDQTSGSSGTTADASVNGGTTAYSAATDVASIVVAAVNDAPVLNTAASPALTSVIEDAAAPSGAVGTLVSSLVDFAAPSGQLDNVTDVDAGAVAGVAITSADATNGSWFYSINNGSVWSPLGTPVTIAARLLAADANSRLYFQPTANFSGSIASALTFRAWDQTGGTNGSTADASVIGGATAYSAATDVASIVVTAVNDAPVLNTAASPALAAASEDATSPSGAVGTLVSSLVDFAAPSGQLDNVTDVDAGAVTGIAITAVDGSQGTWFFSTNGGGSWAFLGPVSNSSAQLLAADANSRLYFQPNANFNGVLPSAITFRAWDQTSGTNGSTADAGTNGGTAAFSAASDVATLTVTAVNDAPVNSLPTAQTTPQDQTLVLSTGAGNGVSISDADAGGASVQVTLSATNGAISLSGIAGLSFSSGTGTNNTSMTFTGTIANVNNALNGVSFSPILGFSGTASVTITTNDQGNTGSGGNLSDLDVLTINVTPANVQVSVKAMLEGPYDPNTGLMGDALRAANVIPTGEPYTALGHLFVGGGGESISPTVFTTTGNNAIVDWVIVELRDNANPSIVVNSRSALIQRDGDVVATDGTSPVTLAIGPGTYRVALRHRIHLGVMTLNGVPLSGLPTSVNFTSVATSTYGTAALKSVSGTFPTQALWAGDVSFNGEVKYTGSANDRDPILVTVGSTTPNNIIANTYSTRDVNMNGNVQYTGSGNDRDPILVNVGSTTPNNLRLQQLP